MKANLERLKSALGEWLTREDLLGDAHFYEIADWRARDEDYLNSSELVLVFDGSPLHTILNYGGDQDEFDDLIESFGFFYELGHSWNMGFYPLDGFDFRPCTGSYSEKLRDPRWRRKAELVKKRAGAKCQDCDTAGPLEAHHCYYTALRYGNEPWEYPLGAFRALCRACHASREVVEIRMRAFMAALTQGQMEQLRSGLVGALNWFETDAVLSALESIRPSDPELQEAARALASGLRDD